MKILYFLLIIILPSLCLGQTISGTVKTVENEPLSGVTIAIKDTRIATATDAKGQFVIQLSGETSVLHITGENVETMNILVSGKVNVNIIAKLKVNSLDDVHVFAIFLFARSHVR